MKRPCYALLALLATLGLLLKAEQANSQTGGCCCYVVQCCCTDPEVCADDVCSGCYYDRDCDDEEPSVPAAPVAPQQAAQPSVSQPLEQDYAISGHDAAHDAAVFGAAECHLGRDATGVACGEDHYRFDRDVNLDDEAASEPEAASEEVASEEPAQEDSWKYEYGYDYDYQPVNRLNDEVVAREEAPVENADADYEAAYEQAEAAAAAGREQETSQFEDSYSYDEYTNDYVHNGVLPEAQEQVADEVVADEAVTEEAVTEEVVTEEVVAETVAEESPAEPVAETPARNESSWQYDYEYGYEYGYESNSQPEMKDEAETEDAETATEEVAEESWRADADYESAYSAETSSAPAETVMPHPANEEEAVSDYEYREYYEYEAPAQNDSVQNDSPRELDMPADHVETAVDAEIAPTTDNKVEDTEGSTWRYDYEHGYEYRYEGEGEQAAPSTETQETGLQEPTWNDEESAPDYNLDYDQVQRSGNWRSLTSRIEHKLMLVVAYTLDEVGSTLQGYSCSLAQYVYEDMARIAARQEVHAR